MFMMTMPARAECRMFQVLELSTTVQIGLLMFHSPFFSGIKICQVGEALFSSPASSKPSLALEESSFVQC